MLLSSVDIRPDAPKAVGPRSQSEEGDMARFDYRDERLRNEILDAVAGVSWHAIRAWQTAEEGRPCLTVQRVRDEADNCLFAIRQAEDCEWVTSTAVDVVLLSLGRVEAENYL
jgi:hypothetical protein